MTRDAAVLGVPTLTAFADRPASVNNFFFFNDTPPPEIYTPLYTLSLHDALPIWQHGVAAAVTKDVEVGVDACFGDRGAPVLSVALGSDDGRRDAAIGEREQRLI